MMHAAVGRRRGFQPRDEATHFAMSDFALSNDHTMPLHGRDKSNNTYRGHPAVFSANPRPIQRGGANESPRQTMSFCAQTTRKNDATVLPMSAEAKLFSADGYAGIRSVSDMISSPEGGGAARAQDDQHKSKESDLLLFDWPELDDLEDLETDLRKFDPAFEIGSGYFDEPVWPSICSADVQLVPSSHFGNPHYSSNAANESESATNPALKPTVSVRDTTDQQPSRKKGKETPLNCSSSSVGMEHFPRLPDADLFCPFEFDDMLVPSSSSIMCNDEIMSSSAARSSRDDVVSAYVSTKNNQPRATPDMILDEMAGNPLEMYFPPLTTYEQPQMPMSSSDTTSTHTQQLLPEGFAGDRALDGAALQFGSKPSKGRRSLGGAREKARSSSIPEAAPAKHPIFQKLQEGMNQLDVGTKACIRDALYRLANSVEQRHCVDQNVGSSGGNRLKASGVWAETERGLMDRSVAQLLLQKPLHRKMTADHAA